MKNLLILLLLLIPVSLNAVGSNLNGEDIIKMKYETDAENILFVSPNGTGDCSSRETACGFREAVLNRVSSTSNDTIYVANGNYDLDNGSDGTGTEIIVNKIKLIGDSGQFTSTITLYNSHAAATKILTFTGQDIVIEGFYWSNAGQASTDVINLHFDGTVRVELTKSGVAQLAGAAGTGILIDNNAISFYMQNISMSGLVDYGIQIDGAAFGTFEDMVFNAMGVGINIAGATDNTFIFRHIAINGSTLGLDLDNSSGFDITIDTISFIGNTKNIDDDSAYGALTLTNIKLDRQKIIIHPITVPINIITGDGAWTPGSCTVVIAENVIDEPFEIINMNIRDFSAAQTFYTEIRYGETAPADITLGFYEFTTVVGGKVTANLGVDGFRPISTDSSVCVVLQSDGAGFRDIDATLSVRLTNP